MLSINGNARAQRIRPIQVALITPAQIFSEDDAIVGIRLNLIYGRNAYVKGLDFGLINYAETTHGIQIGLVNIISQNGAFPVFRIVNWSF